MKPQYILYLATLLFITFLTLPTQANATQNSAENDSAHQFFNTINQRLSYMPDVALYKAQHQLAIENIAREQVVINAAIKEASKLGLDSRKIRKFFVVQIDAAKAIQYRYRAELLSDPIEKLAPDLNQSIRPALIKLGDKINQQMAKHIKQFGVFKSSQQALFFRTIQQPLMSKRDKQRLFDALLAIK